MGILAYDLGNGVTACVGANTATNNNGIGNSVKVEGRGSTGRTIPNDVLEQSAMKDAMKNPFEHIPGSRDVSIVKSSLSDSRWLGW